MDIAANLVANWWAKWDFPEAGTPVTKSKYLGLESIFKIIKRSQIFKSFRNAELIIKTVTNVWGARWIRVWIIPKSKWEKNIALKFIGFVKIQ